jgi:hypothetical protein
MEAARRITGGVSPELLDRAQRARGVGITETVRTGLQLVAASLSSREAPGRMWTCWIALSALP